MTTTTAQDASFLEQVDLTTVVDLHRSNVLRLEMQELVNEVQLRLDLHQPDHHSMAEAAHAYMTLVAKAIEDMDTKNIKLDNKCPFRVKSDLKIDVWNVSKLQVVLPHNFGAMIKPSGNAHVLPTLELQVQIPNACLDAKDYQRNRWFQKRAMLVHFVFSRLQHVKGIGHVHWQYQHGDERKPLLLLIPPHQHSQKKKRRARFRVVVTFGTESLDWIPPLRLVPSRCNLTGVEKSLMYNLALAEDFGPDLGNLDDSEHLASSWVLLQVWCRQRGLICQDGLSRERIGYLLLYLYRTKQVTPRMVTTQVLAVFFKLCAETPWLDDSEVGEEKDDSNLIRKAPFEAFQIFQQRPREVLVLPDEDCNVQQTITASELARRYATQTRDSPLTDHDPPTLVELYRTAYDLGPVLLDPTMTHNLLGRVSPSCCRLLRHEAKTSLKIVNEVANANQFSNLFMLQARFWDRYDAYLRVPLAEVDWDKDWARRASDLGSTECVSRAVVDILQRALGDRVFQLRILSTGNGKVLGDPVHDSDNIPTFDLHHLPNKKVTSATGDDFLVIGLTLNTDACGRVVDRGPPADDLAAKQEFLDLWGTRAELRRFKDGAIIHAVVWGHDEQAKGGGLVHFQNQDSMQGGIVERIVQYILGRHFLKTDSMASFGLRKLQSYVDGVQETTDDIEGKMFNPVSAHKRVMKIFDELSEFLRKNSAPSSAHGSSGDASRLGIPLPVEAVEPLSPSLRYVELFPPISHPLLGGPSVPGIQKVAGAVQSEPIRFQVRFGSSSKWPQDLKAMGAAKTAMLIQLARGIESMVGSGLIDGFEGRIHVTPSYADIPFRGFVFRMFVRADPELKILHELSNPNSQAVRLLQTLHRSTVVASRHHSMVHTVYAAHPSSSSVVRLAKRWVSSHLLTDHLPFEAIELLVVKIYADSQFSDPPGTLMSGFLRFLRLLSSYDWLRKPLIVDPQKHLTSHDLMDIEAQFDAQRGPEQKDGPPMFLISPSDRQGGDGNKESPSWRPTFTAKVPEMVALARAVALAQRSYDALDASLSNFDDHAWSSIFHETSTSFRAYSALLRIDADFVVDEECSSTGSSAILHHTGDKVETSYTRSMRHRYYGPKALRRKLYRNLMMEADDKAVLLEWNPVSEMVGVLRTRLDASALFFYNDLCPEVVAVLWRRMISRPRPFSAVVSEYVRPQDEESTLVRTNVSDLLREMSQLTSGIVIDEKVLEDDEEESRKGEKKRKAGRDNDDSD